MKGNGNGRVRELMTYKKERVLKRMADGEELISFWDNAARQRPEVRSSGARVPQVFL